MNFSEIVPYQIATYSHSGEYLAISNNKNLYVSISLKYASYGSDNDFALSF